MVELKFNQDDAQFQLSRLGARSRQEDRGNNTQYFRSSKRKGRHPQSISPTRRRRSPNSQKGVPLAFGLSESAVALGSMRPSILRRPSNASLKAIVNDVLLDTTPILAPKPMLEKEHGDWRKKSRPVTSDSVLRRSSGFLSVRVADQVRLLEALQDRPQTCSASKLPKNRLAAPTDGEKQHRGKPSANPANTTASDLPRSYVQLAACLKLVEDCALAGLGEKDAAFLEKAKGVVRRSLFHTSKYSEERPERRLFCDIVQELESHIRDLKTSLLDSGEQVTILEDRVQHLEGVIRKNSETLQNAVEVKAKIEGLEERRLEHIQHLRTELVKNFDKMNDLEQARDSASDLARRRDFQLAETENMLSGEKAASSVLKGQLKGYTDRIRILEAQIGNVFDENKLLRQENAELRGRSDSQAAAKLKRQAMLNRHGDLDRHLEIPPPEKVPTKHIVVPVRSPKAR